MPASTYQYCLCGTNKVLLTDNPALHTNINPKSKIIGLNTFHAGLGSQLIPKPDLSLNTAPFRLVYFLKAV